MLQFTNVQKYYNSFLAVDIPSLFVEQGIWWLQGENGTGKTTFLKMIAGLHPFTGNITLQDQYSLKNKRQQYLRQVNYAEAEPLYPSFLTGKDLVQLYCHTKQGKLHFAVELLKLLHIYSAYDQPIGSYSSGMIKKLSLVLAFIGQPALILLDEPLITIDAAAIASICHLINQTRLAGVSFIITSHQPVDAGLLTFTGKLVAQNKTISIV